MSDERKDRTGRFNVLGRGYIQISNKLLVDTGQTDGKLVDHTFPIILWEERSNKLTTRLSKISSEAVTRAHATFTIASCATMCLQMTGIDPVDAGSALADALESLMLDNAFDVGYLHDKYPKDNFTAGIFNNAAYARREPFRFVRMKGQWPPPDVCGMLLGE